MTTPQNDDQFFKTEKETREWLDIYGISHYSLNYDLSVNVESGVLITPLIQEALEYLPVRFAKVKNSFICSHLHLKSLKGAPRHVGLDFNCSHNQLTSLEGAPTQVGLSFQANNNCLTNLKGLSPIIGKSILLGNNQLTTIKGLPKKVLGDLDLQNNALTSLIGGPRVVLKDFQCSQNKITTWQDFPDTVGGLLNVMSNEIKTLQDFYIDMPEKSNIYLLGNDILELQHVILNKSPSDNIAPNFSFIGLNNFALTALEGFGISYNEIQTIALAIREKNTISQSISLEQTDTLKPPQPPKKTQKI